MKKVHLPLLIFLFLVITFSQNIQNQVLQRPENCSKQLNLYWTGFRCACRVGYVQILGNCQKIQLPTAQQAFRPSEFIYKISKLYRTIECSRPNQVSNGLQCICVEGYFRNQTGSCQMIKTCPNNSIFVNGNCICNSGFQLDNQLCLKICPQNSKDNGFGQCICIDDHHKDDLGQCVFGEKCPQNSSKNAAGICICNPGFIKNVFADGHINCVRCPEGTFWNQERSKCQIICSQNSKYNALSGKCQCIDGFAIFNDICQACPTDFFIQNNYCVSCPISSTSNGKECVCNQGFNLNQMGFCAKSCPQANQQYQATGDTCICKEGFGRLNGLCVVCPNGVNASTNICNQGCGMNEILSNGVCTCRSGFGIDSNRNCIDCMSIDGGIQVDGFCAICPNGFIRSGNSCQCPSGQKNQDGRCIQQCAQGQLVDANGQCYFCLINQIPVNGKCQCKAGFQRKEQRCQAMCAQGNLIINGICGRCALDTVYNQLLQSCICAQGFYKNNLGICERSIPQPPVCQTGFYPKVGEGCLKCSDGCASCDSAEKCNTCLIANYNIIGGKCFPPCGNSIIDVGETCDDSNTQSNDGCSSTCMTETGWRCENQPSICQRLPTIACGDGKKEGSEECDDGNLINQDGCSSICKIQQEVQIPDQGMSVVSFSANSQNIFVIVQTDSLFRFANENQMRNFIQYEFQEGLTPNSAFCMQDFNPLLFRCLFVYANGVPNRKFKIILKYNKDSKTGRLTVEVDPLQTNFALRSLV